MPRGVKKPKSFLRPSVKADRKLGYRTLRQKLDFEVPGERALQLNEDLILIAEHYPNLNLADIVCNCVGATANYIREKDAKIEQLFRMTR